MFESLKEKTAVVVGGNGGIGKAVVKLLLNCGINTALVYNRTPVDERELEKMAGGTRCSTVLQEC